MAKFASLDRISSLRAREETPAADMPLAAKYGRPPGKRSDATMEPANLILGKQTKFAAKQVLEQRRILGHGRRDLSMLVEDLLRAWIAENTHA